MPVEHETALERREQLAERGGVGQTFDPRLDDRRRVDRRMMDQEHRRALLHFWMSERLGERVELPETERARGDERRSGNGRRQSDDRRGPTQLHVRKMPDADVDGYVDVALRIF